MKKIIIILFCLLLVGCSNKKPSVLEEKGVEIQLISIQENGVIVNTLVFTQGETYIVYFFDELDKVSFVMFYDNIMGLAFAYMAGIDAKEHSYLMLTANHYYEFLKEKSLSAEDMNLLVENYLSSNKDKINVIHPEDMQTNEHSEDKETNADIKVLGGFSVDENFEYVIDDEVQFIVDIESVTYEDETAIIVYYFSNVNVEEGISIEQKYNTQMQLTYGGPNPIKKGETVQMTIPFPLQELDKVNIFFYIYLEEELIAMYNNDDSK